MNNIKFNIILIIFISLTFTKFVNAETNINEMNFYDFKIEDIQGDKCRVVEICQNLGKCASNK